jgi:hypothetical protein
MTLPIPLSQLTAGESALRNAELTRRRAAYQQRVAYRRSAYELLRRARGTAGEAAARARASAAARAERTQSSIYGRYRTPTQQFGQEYSKLNALTSANRGASTEALINRSTAFDPAAARQRASALSQLDQYLAQLGQSRQQLEQDYASNRALAEAQQPEINRGLLSGFAGRGMAYSSGYGQALGRSAADYARQLAALDTARSRGQAAASGQEAGARASYGDTLSNILFDSANRLSSQAGTLGLAGSNIPYLLEIIRRRQLAGG